MKNSYSNEKTYTLYIIFLKKTDELYAYTTKKKYAKMFLEQRNSDKFILRKEEVNQEELNDIYKDFPVNRIEEKDLASLNQDTMEKVVVNRVMTTSERMTLNGRVNTIIMSSQVRRWFPGTKFPDTIIKDKYKKYLSTLKYYSDFYSDKDVFVDELGCFLKLIWSTL